MRRFLNANSALWAWRIAVLALGLLILLQLRSIERSIPDGFGYANEDRLETIADKTRDMERQLHEIERNTRR
jgi:hypothetical protein